VTTPPEERGWATRGAVVTGGANGIGEAIVRRLAGVGVSRGAVVDLPDAVSGASAPKGWTGVGVDLRDDEWVTKAFEAVREAVGTVDLLVAAAGIVPLWTGIADLDPQEWDDVFRVNARGVMRSIQECVPAIPNGGTIVVIASQNAWRGNENLASYVASKHAVLGLVRSLALELGPRGIRVNAIGPGSVATDAYVGRLRRREGEGGLSVDDALAREAATAPLRRLTTVDDVAGATLLLASELASAVTGHLLPVGAPLA
jgi:NAD(P)-dependent dehydrogenase (short-subunit alcohol dehydrogenase family)